MLKSSDGRHSYKIAHGVPILIDDATCIFTSAEVADSGTTASDGRSFGVIARRLIPSGTHSVGTGERFDEFERLVRELAGTDRPRILVVGGGELGNGMGRLAAASDIDLVETDIYLGPRVMVACDGHDLPFADASFDGAIAEAVLEHVLSPERVVAEMHRVLRPRGLVYAETPFMQQVHEGAFDFTRFTEVGHRRLFRSFDAIDRGVAVGPATALVWSLRYFARALPARSFTASRILDKIVLVCIFWLKYLDRWLAGHPGAIDAASGVYFLGRRAEDPASDKDIVATYTGTMRSVAVTRKLD